MIKANRVVVDLLERIGAGKECNPGADCTGLAAGAKTLDCSHPGSRKLERLDENIGSVNIHLTSEDLRLIDDAMSQIQVVGDRY